MWPAWPRLRFPVRRASWPTSLQALSSLEWLGIVASCEGRVAREEKTGLTRHTPLNTRHSSLATRHSPLITRHSPLITRHYSEPLQDSPRVSRGKLCRSPRPRKG